MMRLEENPALTYPAGASVRDMGGTWWVGHTKARQEKAFARELGRRGISYFLPMTRRVRYVRGRRLVSLMPLFASYVFACGDEAQRIDALKGNRLAGTIKVADQERLVAEMVSIERAIRAGGAELEAAAGMAEGRRVRVTAGPFEGIEGVVARHDGRARLVLSVESLGQSVALEIDAALLEAAEP